MSALDFPCAVSIETAAHLTGGPSYYGDDLDELARDLALDELELADLCAKSTGLRIEICKIAKSTVADRHGAIAEAIKEHAADELQRRLDNRDEEAAIDAAFGGREE